MRRTFAHSIVVILVLFCSFSIDLFAQNLPTWIIKPHYDKTYRPADQHLSSGYYYLYSDNQTNIDTQETYGCLAMKVVDENGLGEVSSVSASYDSTYQTFRFAHIHIIRNGKVMDVLQKQSPEVLRREEQLERGILNGRLTVYLEVNDLRVGDILEYSFIHKGFNPIKKDFIHWSYNMGFLLPIGKVQVCFLTTKPDNYQYQLFNKATEPTIRKEAGSTLYQWVANDPEILDYENDAPSWFSPYPEIYFTARKTWKTVSQHVYPLFSTNDKLSEEVLTFLADVKTTHENKEAQALECIKYVQNNIRYLGNENGIYAYKPRNPNTIFTKKSGDCKEKSWLLSTLLREIGFEAYPLLVNSFKGHSLARYAPAMDVFDHCVMLLKNGTDSIFIDPTSTNQGGQLNNIWFPNYETGLVVSPASESLISISYRAKDQTIVDESFEIDDFTGQVVLKVKTIYKGGDADMQRSYLKNNSNNDLQDAYLRFYADMYPRIDTLKSFSLEDNIQTNELKIIESYQIENFWQVEDSLNPNQISAYFYALSLKSMIAKDNYPARKSPLALSHPTDYRHTITVHLPEEWTIKDETANLSAPGFNFNRNITYNDKTLQLDYHYKTLKSFIEKEEYLDFIEKHEKIYDELSYGLLYYKTGNTPSTGGGFNIFIFVIGFLVVLLGSIGARKLYFYDPAVQMSFQNFSSGIGGWLVLPTIGVTLTPIILLASLFSNDYLDLETWALLFNPSSSFYSPTHAMFILWEFSFNLLFVVYSILVAILLYSRRSSLPRMVIILYVANFLFLLADYILAMTMDLEVTNDVNTQLIKSLVAVIIWVPYFILSERVKQTFTKTLKPKQTVVEEKEAFIEEKEAALMDD